MKLIRAGSNTLWFLLALELAIAGVLASLAALPTPSSAQNNATTTTTPSAVTTDGLPCASKPVSTPDPSNNQMDPFLGPLVGPSLPPGLLPINNATRNSIFGVGLPCQERVNPKGQEKVGLDNLQRGFDFYSWRTFVALNSPADGSSIESAKADTPTLWEDMNSFKQLLDVMLPANVKPPSWPAARAGMEAERERLVPAECSALHSQMPERMIVKMIEESFNEPFKTVR